MKVISRQNLQNPSFGGFKVDPNDATKFLLKKKSPQIWDTFSFLTAVTSATGFAIGGAGLLSDYLSKEKKQPSLKKNTQVPDSFKNFETAGLQDTVPESKTDKKKEGAKTIVPSTKFSKIGLTFAKIGIAFSGIAGIFNGVSMGLPLMAAGEALNLCASPIIETPLGTGLFGIALAAVFSGRALENDPELKLDKSKLKEKEGLKNKASYIWKNIKGCAEEVWRSGKVIGTNLVDLAKKDKRTEAVSFFRDNVFAIKPKKLVIQEFVDKNGIVTIKRATKNNPYLMHGASLLLAAGGLTLALSSLLKNSTGQKVGLKTYEVGGSLDNLSLSRWGMEKAAIAGAGDPAAKLAGYLLGASGLTILAGQPGVDEKWGRGIQWVGTALLFSVFAVERLPKAFKILKSQPEFTSLMRQWEIDLTKLYSNKDLKPKLASILKGVSEDKIGEIKDPTVKKMMEVINKVLDKSKYNSSTEDIFAQLKTELESIPELKGKFDDIVKHLGKDDDLTSVMNSLKKQTNEAFISE